MSVTHVGGQVINQMVVKRERSGWTNPVSEQRETSYRERLTQAIQSVFSPAHSLGRTPYRPDALLTPEQLWQVYKESGDVRGAVESIARKVSSKKWTMTAIPSTEDEELHALALEQCRSFGRFLKAPNDDDTWQTFVFKLVIDATVFFHGTAEAAYAQVLTSGVDENGMPSVAASRGPLQQLWPVYGPSIHPVSDEQGRIIGYVQDLGASRGVYGTENIVKLDKQSIVRLQLNPNTRSPYSVPIIETLVKEITILQRGAERAMLELDVGEVPSGFLVLTGTSNKVVKDMKEASRHYRGRSNKMRIIHSPGASSPAHWLRMHRDFTEIQLLPVAEQARKLIWRLFGVSPVSQGETTNANRSDSDAMLEVDENGLFSPILDMLEAIINMRVLPLLAERHGKPGDPSLCHFGFERKRKTTPQDDLDQAKADEVRLDSGTRNVNELRQRDGLPPVEGGEVYRINGVSLGDGSAEGSGEVDADSAQIVSPEAGEEAPGEAVRYTDISVRRRSTEDLPSEWQSPGMFDGLRTIDLRGLWDEVTRYRKGVEPLWSAMESEVLAATSAAWSAGQLGGSQHLTRVSESLSTLRELWSMETLRRYRAVGELARKSAIRLAGDSSIGGNWEFQASQYHEQAMSHLDQLISDIQSRVIANVQAVAVGRTKVSAEAGLGPDSSLGDLLGAVEHSVDANEMRIDNWSGRLIELAYLVMLQSMLEAPPTITPVGPGDAVVGPQDGQEAKAGEWWVGWEAVGDKGTCETCERESNLGLRPMVTLSTVPGGDTECRARCRCLLVIWTKEEVDSGTARVIIT